MLAHYFFSGCLTRSMIDKLSHMPDYKPIDVLVSQVDRSSVRTTLKYQQEGLVDKIFIDSGAFSFHTGKATLDLEDYINYLNELDDRIFVCAQVDTIPGKFGQPKTDQDYIDSANASWENYLYMRTKLKSPKKLTPVFHYGESFDALQRMLDWRDENGEPIDYIGISPANDTGQNIKNLYMRQVYDFIAKSSHPNVKTHLYGMTSLEGLAIAPAYSCDSISHRHIAAYNKLLIPEFGIVSMTRIPRTSRSRSGMNFAETADDIARKKLEDYLAKLGTTIEECENDSAVRCAVSMYTIIQELKKGTYHPETIIRPKKLFNVD